MDGILRCSKYAFGPNRLHYCGPDRNKEIFSYIEEKEADEGLAALMSQFETMYPYLAHIAEANGIKDPFDERVMEAYWIGNELLETIPKQKFYGHLLENMRLKDKLGAKEFSLLTDKIDLGAVPNHSFHVFDVWKKGGHTDNEHTIESMDACRVSYGSIVSISGPFITVRTEPLVYENGKLALGAPIEKKLVRQLESDYDIEQLKSGDIVTMHWNVICEKITPKQLAHLKKYTLQHIALANTTL